MPAVPESRLRVRLAGLGDGRWRRAAVDVGEVERPVGDRLELDIEARPEGIDSLAEVQVDDGAVVEAERAAERVERDLETAVKVPSHRGLEVERQRQPEEGLAQRRLNRR